ncbi:MAG: DUF3108 domain-containing protein, partial [Pseudomonadota bacterium]
MRASRLAPFAAIKVAATKSVPTAALALSLATAPALLAAGTAAQAATVKVENTYEISIAGWGIARAFLNLDYNRGRYDADLLMKPKGVARIVTAVRTTVEAEGQVSRGAVKPSRYRVRATETEKPVAVDMGM